MPPGAGGGTGVPESPEMPPGAGGGTGVPESPEMPPGAGGGTGVPERPEVSPEVGVGLPEETVSPDSIAISSSSSSSLFNCLSIS